jgi:hypothetical protein
MKYFKVSNGEPNKKKNLNLLKVITGPVLKKTTTFFDI